jgi:hypothetical protein
MCIGKSSFTTTIQYAPPTFIHIFKWWGYRGQVVVGNSKVKWWGYLGQVVGISRSSSGVVKVRGRGLEVKVKKKWWGVRALSNSLY